MTYQLHFLGLAHFLDRRRQGKLVLMPNGLDPYPLRVSPHYGSLFIEIDDIEDSSQWPPADNPELWEHGIAEFSIASPSTLAMSGVGQTANSGCWPFGARLDASNQRNLPELENDKKLKIVPEWADTIARMSVYQGTLGSYLFGGKDKGSGVSKLTVEHSGPITILARAGDGSGFKVLKLRYTTREIVLSNTSDLLNPHEDEDTHFRLYARLDVNRNDDNLKVPPPIPDLPDLEFTHKYLTYILHRLGNVPNPDCSNSCC